jgi:hypothetical protein
MKTMFYLSTRLRIMTARREGAPAEPEMTHGPLQTPPPQIHARRLLALQAP